MKQFPDYAKKSDKQLMNIIGGLIIRHCGQIHCHYVPVWDFDNEYYIPNELTIADAICPSMTMMNHSCIPNTSHYFVGDTVVVKAIRKIKIHEDICYSYGGVPSSAVEKHDRQLFLETIYFLKCKCQICTDPRMDAYNSYLCVKCKGPTSLADSNNLYTRQQFVCLDCNYKFTLPKDVIAKEMLAFEFLGNFKQFHDIEDANRCLVVYKTIFSPYHSIFEFLYNELKEYYRLKGDVKRYIENAMLLLDCLEKKRNGPAVKVGRDSYTYCVTALDILKDNAAKMNLEEFGKLLKMLTNLVEKAKAVFNLHHAPFVARLQPVEKLICELQGLYTLRLTNEK